MDLEIHLKKLSGPITVQKICMINLKRLWGAGNKKRKSRPKYLTHPAFIALVGLNIAAASYGAYLWFSQKQIGSFNRPPSSVLIAGHSDDPEDHKSSIRNPFSQKRTEETEDVTPQTPKVLAKPVITAELKAGMERKPVEEKKVDSQNIPKEQPRPIEPPRPIITATVRASMESKPLEVKGSQPKKIDSISLTKTAPAQPKPSEDKPAKVEEKTVSAPVVEPPVAESGGVLISHNANPGKAKPYIKLEKDLASKGYYTVAKGSAYFHNEPDAATQRKAFIIHWNKAILKPIEEKNGFIYIVYTNQWGKTSKGWLNKKDLEAIK